MIHEGATLELASLLLAMREERGRDVDFHARQLAAWASAGCFPDVDAAQHAANREHEDRALAGF